MTCAKATVRCTLVTPDSLHIIGTNWCAKPQPACPRLPGEGYEKCRSICEQQGHAEADAIRVAGHHAMGARAYIEGHTYACRACQEALFGAGVAALTIGPPPEPGFPEPTPRTASAPGDSGRTPSLSPPGSDLDGLARQTATPPMPSDPMQELIEAAKAAAAQFEHYAQLHKAKGTREGNTKAFTNAAQASHLRAALSNAETHPALKAAGGWRAIESAPKDGTHVLVTIAGGGGLGYCGAVNEHGFRDPADWCDVVHWFDDPDAPGFYSTSWGGEQDKPFATLTHWTPLPPAPGSLALGAVPEGGEDE